MPGVGLFCSWVYLLSGVKVLPFMAGDETPPATGGFQQVKIHIYPRKDRDEKVYDNSDINSAILIGLIENR